MQDREIIEMWNTQTDTPSWDYAAGVFESAADALAHVRANRCYERRVVRIGGQLYRRMRGEIELFTRAGFVRMSDEYTPERD
jgi:hypothetical protein